MLRQDSCGGSYLLHEFVLNFETKKGAVNLAAHHLSRLENPPQDKFEKKEINEAFPIETLGSVALQDQSGKTVVFLGHEALDILKACHSGPTGDTMVPIYTARKSSIHGFYWPHIYKDDHDFVSVVTLSTSKEKSGNVMRLPQNSIKFAISLTSGALTFMGRSRTSEGTSTYSWLLTTCQNG
ncbi:hypothetical protein Tco_0834727 [Tanacetum coccineum]